MNAENYKNHFVAGFVKRAEEHGLDKEAFLPILANIGLNMAGHIGAIKGLNSLAKLKKIPKARAGKSLSFLDSLRNKGIDASRTATKYLTNSSPEHIGKNMLANMALSTGVSSVVDPISQRITNMVEPQQNTYNGNTY